MDDNFSSKTCQEIITPSKELKDEYTRKKKGKKSVEAKPPMNNVATAP